MRLAVTDMGLFVRKTVAVFVLSIALVPLIAAKGTLPALLYAGALVVIHVGVLVIYLYRVRIRELDPDLRSLAARLLALAVVSYLLVAASSFGPDTPRSTLVLQMLAVSALHMVVLLLMMVRVTRPEPDAASAAVALSGTASGDQEGGE